MTVLDLPAAPRLERVVCDTCGRPLHDPVSVARLRGPVCSGALNIRPRRPSFIDGQQELALTCPVPGDDYRNVG